MEMWAKLNSKIRERNIDKGDNGRNKNMKKTLVLLGIFMAFSVNAVNAQNNSAMIENEFWKHESDSGIHFIMYYFSNNGTYIQYYGYTPRNYMNQVRGFMHTLIRGKYYSNENNIIKLEVTSKEGFDKYLDFADVNTLSLEIVRMNNDSVEVKFPVENGTITTNRAFSRFKNINEEGVLEKHFGISSEKDDLEKYLGVSSFNINAQRTKTKIGNEEWYSIYFGPTIYVFQKDSTFIYYPTLSQMMYEYQPQIRGEYIQENNILNFEKVHLINLSDTDFNEMEFHRTLEILQINEHFVKLKYTDDGNEDIFFAGRRKLPHIASHQIIKCCK
jgi:hypothetical protein